MITGRLSGDTELLLKLQSRGILMRSGLRTTVREQGVRLLALVKEKLGGPVLKNRTGRLRRSINVLFTETIDEITGSVGTKVKYARVHELGIDKMVDVREHLRTVTMVFGRAIDPVQARVGAHTMHMRMPERSFLRSALREQGPAIREAMRASIKGALQ